MDLWFLEFSISYVALKPIRQIIAADSDVRTIRDRESGQVRALKQIAYADLGQAYPVRIQITVKEPLQPGLYEAQVPYRVGRYDSLEISGFDPWVCKRVESKSANKVA